MVELVIVALASFALFGLGTHFALLWLSPCWATDRQIGAGLRRGGRMNTMLYGARPRAGGTSVPLANPDSLGARVYLDLSEGPLVVEGLGPQTCVYWSASVFARNTDVVWLRSDRESPDRAVKLAIRTRAQTPCESVANEAVLPSRTGVLMLRAFMRDRTDDAAVENLAKELRGLTVRPARPA